MAPWCAGGGGGAERRSRVGQRDPGTLHLCTLGPVPDNLAHIVRDALSLPCEDTVHGDKGKSLAMAIAGAGGPPHAVLQKPKVLPLLEHSALLGHKRAHDNVLKGNAGPVGRVEGRVTLAGGAGQVLGAGRGDSGREGGGRGEHDMRQFLDGMPYISERKKRKEEEERRDEEQ
jgi:hypothetical protein